MNKQLQALAKQAELYVDLYGQPYPRAMSAEESDAAYKKFAELIVRQMLDITDSHTEVFQTDRDRALIEHIKKSVTQHFGVEQ